MICNADIFRMIHYVLHFKKKYRHYFIFGIIQVYRNVYVAVVDHLRSPSLHVIFQLSDNIFKIRFLDFKYVLVT